MVQLYKAGPRPKLFSFAFFLQLATKIQRSRVLGTGFFNLTVRLCELSHSQSYLPSFKRLLTSAIDISTVGVAGVGLHGLLLTDICLL